MDLLKLKQAGLVCGAVLFAATGMSQKTDSFIGRWDLTVHGERGDQASWIEVSKPHGVLKVQLVGPVGDAAEAVHVKVNGGQLEFLSLKDPNEGKNLDVLYKVHFSGEHLVGSLRATDGSVANWTGIRVQDFKPASKVAWGEPVSLFNGKNLDGWHFSQRNHANWVVHNGAFSTTGHGPELISDRKFQDFKLHLEFMSGPRSNSGLYLRGRYEVQIETNSAREKASHHTGGVYGFLAPQPEQPRKADVWQTFDIVLLGRTLTVVQNGITVIDRKEIPGITGGAIDSHEYDPGPIYLQGSEDGTTSFRNVVITSARD